MSFYPRIKIFVIQTKVSLSFETVRSFQQQKERKNDSIALCTSKLQGTLTPHLGILCVFFCYISMSTQVKEMMGHFEVILTVQDFSLPINQATDPYQDLAPPRFLSLQFQCGPRPLFYHRDLDRQSKNLPIIIKLGYQEEIWKTAPS